MPKQILVADDSVTVRKMVEMTFAMEDYQITTVGSGDEALAKARQRKPDVMILDCVMPGKDGYEVAQACKSDPQLQSIACLLMGGNSSPYDEARGQKSGVDAFIPKPFDTQALLDKVAELAASGGKVLSSSARPAIPSSTSPTIDTIQIAPLSAPQGAAADDDAIDISLDAPAPRPRTATPAPAPRVQPFATPRPATIPTPAPIPTPRPAPPVVNRPSATQPTPMPDLTPVPQARSASQVSQLPSHAGPSMMPLTVPQMPRPSLIPNVPTPIARATPRGTMLGIPTVNPAALSQAAAQAVIQATASAQGADMGSVTNNAAGVVPGTNIARNSPEYQLLQSMSREVIERIVWEIVPDLAETIIREQLDRLVRERTK